MRKWKILAAEGTLGTFILRLCSRKTHLPGTPCRGSNCCCSCLQGRSLHPSTQVCGALSPPGLSAPPGPPEAAAHPSEALASCQLCSGDKKAVVAEGLCLLTSKERGSQGLC